MTIYDGSEFGAIDQQAYEDGRPSDEWLRRKIENNVAHLTITEPPVTVMRRGGDVQSDDAGPYFADRAIASIIRSVFLAVPVWVTPSTNEIKIHVNFVTRAAVVRVFGDEQRAVSIGGGVRSVKGVVLGALDPVSYEKTGTYATEGLTTFTIPVQSGGSQWAVAYLTVVSVLDNFGPSEKSQVSSAFGSGSTEVALNMVGTPPLYNPVSNPSSATLAFFDHCVMVDDQSTSFADVLAFDSNMASTILGIIPANKITPGLGSAMDFVGIQPISFMQMRSYTIEVVNRYNLREFELLSGLPERGIDSLRHGQSVISLRSRYRLVAAGPTGWMPGLPIRYATQGRHPQVWESALGISVGNFAAPPHTLVKTGTTESLSDGRVKIVMLVHACVHSGLGTGTVDWELVATVGNWIGADETLTQTYPIVAVGTNDAWSRVNGGDRGAAHGKWIPNIQRAVRNFSGSQYYGCRDGQFLENEFSDLTLVVMDLPMPATGGSAGLNIEVTAECVGNMQDIAADAFSLSGQHLTCVAWSVYIVPEESA